ncbi:MAG: T9SS type A sorting domain-containing protein, partial [Saprospiraceae bacterium]|nr:T9SS type A sorting domain-containing protein [Saprospiraceae bacterium]
VTLITQNYCCSDTFQVEVQVGVVGTEEALVKPFRLQPNPVDDLLHIQLMLTDRFEYALTDLNGRQIGQGELHGSQTLQLGALEPGLYLLSLWNDERVYTEKLWVR